MKWEDFEKVLKRVLDCPTAPFHEYHVRDALLEMLGTMPRVSLEEDAFGNLIATYRRGKSPGRFALGAHMDHPGWVRSSVSGNEISEWKFLGGVPDSYLKDPIISEFGSFAMWDLPALDVRDGFIHSRACDDLVNCAVIVALFTVLEEWEAEVRCHGIFTRAEEVGFVGAIEVAKGWPLPEDAVFVSLETSAPVGDVTMGKGPVLRVGDRLSIFDSELTLDIAAVAREGGIDVQRALLDKGACEATAMQAFGVRSAGLSIPLGNYHNCGADGTIECEYVSVDDVLGMVQLVEAMVVEPPALAQEAIRQRLGGRAGEYAREISATRKWFQER